MKQVFENLRNGKIEMLYIPVPNIGSGTKGNGSYLTFYSPTLKLPACSEATESSLDYSGEL